MTAKLWPDPVRDDRYRLDSSSTAIPTAATSSPRVIEWLRIGIGFGLGVLLAVGLVLVMRMTRGPPARALIGSRLARGGRVVAAATRPRLQHAFHAEAAAASAELLVRLLGPSPRRCPVRRMSCGPVTSGRSRPIVTSCAG